MNPQKIKFNNLFTLSLVSGDASQLSKEMTLTDAQTSSMYCESEVLSKRLSSVDGGFDFHDEVLAE
jgi:hypothetical protein